LYADVLKGVGRKISRGRGNGKKTENSINALISLFQGGGGNGKKDRK